MDLSVSYMGLKLDNPLIASSSPLTASIGKIVELERAGIGAVVLKSIFEEQIAGKAEMLGRYSDYPEAADYLRAYVGSDYLSGFNTLIKQAKSRTSLPVIASINCVSAGNWIRYARDIEEAGADAIELNIFFLPTDAGQSSEGIEERYLATAAGVAESVSIPVSVKLSMRFTNVLRIISEAHKRGIRAAVLYNRLFEPDVNIHTLEYIPANGISSPVELHNSLRNIAMASAAVPDIDLAVSTGVHDGEGALKAILAGADAVQICSALLISGPGVIAGMKSDIVAFMEQNSFGSVSDFRSLMNGKAPRVDNEMLGRAQYMKYFPSTK